MHARKGDDGRPQMPYAPADHSVLNIPLVRLRYRRNSYLFLIQPSRPAAAVRGERGHGRFPLPGTHTHQISHQYPHRHVPHRCLPATLAHHTHRYRRPVMSNVGRRPSSIPPKKPF
ncbi:hypothetical protein C8Q77DRAFT_222522 [Trametes polyzona]|nr:hypothetical protein C8Q77DRAFT_222522 [Trametes polyzona]